MKVGAPIDVNRLFWFIKHYRYRSPQTAPALGVSEEYATGYTAALDDLGKWLRGCGYEPPT
jgi:hypothetical protein